MKRILLLGGTGAIGIYLAKSLVTKGYEVVVTSRRARPDSDGIKYLCGDGRSRGFLIETLRDQHPDAVVDFMIYPTHEFLDRRELLLSGTSHYFFLSSYTVFADSPIINEESPRLLDTVRDEEFLRSDDYPLKKARCENLLRDSKRTNWTILRPGITYSQSRFQFGCLEADAVCYRSLQGKPIVIAREVLDKRTTLTWAGDVGEMISRLVLKEQAMGQAYNLSTSENHTWREVASIYADVIGLRYKEVSLSEYCRVCGKSPVIYDRMYNRVLDNSKILAATGIHPSELKILKDGLRYELERFKSNPSYANFSLYENALMDRLCGTRIDLHEFNFRQKIEYLRFRYGWIDLSCSIAKFPLRVLRSMTY